METKRIGCRSCSFYSASLGRCRLGKINPRTIKGSKDAARIMGVSYICNINGMQTKIASEQLKVWQKVNGI